MCLDRPGVWEVIPEETFIRLEKPRYVIDTANRDDLYIFTPGEFSLDGQLRFESNRLIDREADDIGLRINGEDYFDLDINDDVAFDRNFRNYFVWIPYYLIAD